jgi:hypothetical protein
MDNVQSERVIFRVEKYAYNKETRHYLAVFPDDKANPGRVAAVPFYFDGHGKAIFEPYCEIDMGYYYDTHLVHRFDPETPKLLKAITDYYSREVPAKFRIMQKLR